MMSRPARLLFQTAFLGATVPSALLLHGDANSSIPPAHLRIWDGKGHAFFLYLPEFVGLTDKPVNLRQS